MTQMEASLVADLEILQKELHLTPMFVERAKKETSAFFNELQVLPSEAKALHGLFTHYLLNPPDNETVGDWGIESIARLREIYGPQTDAVLADAQRFIQSKNGLAEVLDHTGLGNNPEIVLALVRKVQALKVKGKI